MTPPSSNTEGWIQCAWSSGTHTGWVALRQEWGGEELPPLELEGQGQSTVRWYACGKREMAALCGCYPGDKSYLFVLPCSRLNGKAENVHHVYVAGSFNGWQNAIGDPRWQMKRCCWGDQEVWLLSVESGWFSGKEDEFKFVTAEEVWVGPEWESPMRVEDASHHVNYRIDLSRRERFLYGFECESPLLFSNNLTVRWSEEGCHEGVPLQPGGHFLQMGNDLPMGANYTSQHTRFRLFAPRATGVVLMIGREPEAQQWQRHALSPELGGTWSVALPGDWQGAFYGYHVHGLRGSEWTHFDPNHLVLDPYALAVVGRNGPGIVMPYPHKVPASRRFQPAAWQDLIILETHLADLLSRDPLHTGAAPSYSALARHASTPGSYLCEAPVNVVELQPLHQNDGEPVSSYHWGYMPVNYFAPHSGYSMDPLKGTAIEEFREMVAAIHATGKAVVMDVVYNHYGEPNHLLYLDKLYYFRTTREGHLYNFSGCGNDLRTEARMVKRLILDSLRYWVEVFDVDGFRFDLAELVGKPMLREIESELKKIKPGILLIAEPWSFRGHIACELRDTGFTSWNDGYRESTFRYLKGEARAEEMMQYLSGSAGFFARWPSQTVNYLESHDDYTLLDRITTEPGNDGSNPSAVDRRRIHLAIALLNLSIGIPMFAAGIDFLRTKQGKHNTYLDGEANAMDYERWGRFSATNDYWSGWCRWRLSPSAQILRSYHSLPDGYWRVWVADNGRSMAVLYNADGRSGKHRLLFAVNPDSAPASIPVEDWDWSTSQQLADAERICMHGLKRATLTGGNTVRLPGLGCALWEGG